MFGAGAVLYFALSNTLPFPGKTLKKASEEIGLHDVLQHAASAVAASFSHTYQTCNLQATQLQFHGYVPRHLGPYLSLNLQSSRHAPGPPPAGDVSESGRHERSASESEATATFKP